MIRMIFVESDVAGKDCVCVKPDFVANKKISEKNILFNVFNCMNVKW